jgi:hypothetical protein
MKYVKKPVVVEAFQFGVDEEPEWFLDEDGIHVLFHEDYPNCCKIITLEGVMEAWTGDIIIKDNEDKIYPCKEDIFKETYRRCLKSQLEEHGFEPLTKEEEKRNLDRLARLPKV